MPSPSPASGFFWLPWASAKLRNSRMPRLSPSISLAAIRFCMVRRARTNGSSVSTKSAHHYQGEDIDELREILTPGRYHVVVANPPYITVSDPLLSAAYRDRYHSCFRAYSLSVPFMERHFHLATSEDSTHNARAGYTGQITSNAFMRREFGKKVIEEFIPEWDITHVIDTAARVYPRAWHADGNTFRSQSTPGFVPIASGNGNPGGASDTGRSFAWRRLDRDR